MDNAPRPGIDPKLVKELIDAADEAADAMCDSLNLDWGVGNTEFEDVNNLEAAAAGSNVNSTRRSSEFRPPPDSIRIT